MPMAEVCNGGDEAGGFYGFGQVRFVAGLGGFGAVFGAGVRRKGEGGCVAVARRRRAGAAAAAFYDLLGFDFADVAEEAVAVFIRHGDVADEHVGRRFLEGLERGGSRVGGLHDRAGGLEHAVNRDALVGVILDKQDVDAVEILVTGAVGLGGDGG
jgi:hypothetical protein